MRIRDSLHNDHLPNTYFTSSCNDLGAFRRLEGNVRTEVCIIGGGFTGVSAAVELAERGYSVALVEQNLIGWGASGRCGGQILSGPADYTSYEETVGHENAPIAWEMNTAGSRIIQERVSQYAIDCDLIWGGLEIAQTAAEDSGLQAEAGSQRGHEGFAGVDYVDRPQIREFVASDSVVSGLLRKNWGRCHPLNLVRGQARAAESLGARIYEDARVNKIRYGDTIIVDTGHGKVTADSLVLAGNAYLGNLVPQLSAKIVPICSSAMITEILPNEVAEALLPQNSMFRGYGDTSIYGHLMPDNRMLFGGADSDSVQHPDKLEKILRQKLCGFFPKLRDVKCDHIWGGFIGVGENKIPQVGKMAENVFYAQAYAGRGVSNAHVAGRVIAEAIDGNVQRFNILNDIQHMPYARQGMLRRTLGAIGQAFRA